MLFLSTDYEKTRSSASKKKTTSNASQAPKSTIDWDKARKSASEKRTTSNAVSVPKSEIDWDKVHNSVSQKYPKQINSNGDYDFGSNTRGRQPLIVSMAVEEDYKKTSPINPYANRKYGDSDSQYVADEFAKTHFPDSYKKAYDSDGKVSQKSNTKYRTDPAAVYDESDLPFIEYQIKLAEDMEAKNTGESAYEDTSSQYWKDIKANVEKNGTSGYKDPNEYNHSRYRKLDENRIPYEYATTGEIADYYIWENPDVKFKDPVTGAEYNKNQFKQTEEYTVKERRRVGAIKQDFYELDDGVVSDLTLIAKGAEAEEATRGVSGWFLRYGGMNGGVGSTYDAMRHRVSEGKAAKRRLLDAGYTEEQINLWSEMTRHKLDQEFKEEAYADLEAFTEKHPIIGSATSVAYNALMNPVKTILMVDKLLYNDSYTGGAFDTITQAGDMIRQARAEDISQKTGSDVWGELYMAVMSGADTYAASLIMPNAQLAKAFIGLSSGTSFMQSLLEKGVDVKTAFAGGVVAGVLEGLFSSYSIGELNFMKENAAANVREFCANWIKSFVSEATEEAATEAANIITDYILSSGFSDYELLVSQFMSQGYSVSEAKAMAVQELAIRVLKAGIYGGVVGAGFGVVGQAHGYIRNSGNIKATGKQIAESGKTEIALDIAQTAPEGTRPFQLAQYAKEKQSKGKKLSNWDVGVVATEAMKYASENSPQLEGAFASAKTVDDVNRIYDAELDKLKNNPATTKKETKALKSQYKVALESLTKYNSSGARMMVEGKPASVENLVKTKMPTIGRTDDGRVISVSSAESVNDGVITVKTSEGTTQTLDTQALTGKAKELWSYAADNFNDADAINAFVEGYDGGSIDTYSRLFKSTYQMASTGMTESEIKKENLFNVNQLSQKAFSQAVSTGTKLANNKVGVLDVSTGLKTNSQKLTVNMMDNFAKRHGLSIVVVDTLGGTEGKYKPSANQIVVALDASGGALNRVFGHETYHYLKQKNAMQAKQIEDFVFDTMTKLKGKEWVDNFIDKT